MEVDLVQNSCRICRNKNGGELKSLFLDACGSLSELGVLYEELCFKIERNTMCVYPQFLCRTCADLMKTFKELRVRAQETLNELAASSKMNKMDVECGRPPTKEKADIGISEEFENAEESSLKAERWDGKVEESSEEEYTQLEVLEGEEVPGLYMPTNSTGGVQEETTKPTVGVGSVAREEGNANGGLGESDAQYKDVEYLEGEGLDLNDELESHLKLIKQGINSINKNDGQRYRCQPCQLQFEKRAEYVQHRKDVHNNHHICNICGKEFRIRNSLRVHLQVHADNPPYRCELCSKSFTQKAHYKYHMNGHANNRQYKCQDCAKSFLSSTDLKQHMRQHDGERPYACDLCPERFMLVQHLNSHRYKHLQKSFQCGICLKKFSRSNSLQQHVKVLHSVAELQYKCRQCLQRFNKKFHLIAHQKRFHCHMVRLRTEEGPAKLVETTSMSSSEDNKSDQ